MFNTFNEKVKPFPFTTGDLDDDRVMTSSSSVTMVSPDSLRRRILSQSVVFSLPRHRLVSAWHRLTSWLQRTRVQ